MSNIKIVTDADFQSEVLEAGKPVIVDFWAQWCGPCRALTPILEEAAETYADKVIFAKLNVDENSEVPTNFGVMSLPTLMIFKNGQVAATKVGLLTKSQLSAFLESHT